MPMRSWPILVRWRVSVSLARMYSSGSTRPCANGAVPLDDEVREAEELLADLERATSGVAVDSKGFLIDEAVARTARRVVERVLRGRRCLRLAESRHPA